MKAAGKTLAGIGMDCNPQTAAGPPLAGVLNWLMPMHLVLDSQGRVRSHGPTLDRVFAGRVLTGTAFGELFEVKSPYSFSEPTDFAAAVGQKLRLGLRVGLQELRLRGLLVPLPAALGQGAVDAERDNGPISGGGWIVNLSFGIDLPRAVAVLQLIDADFAPTDLAMELLYLTEANVAVTGELRALALRLDGARRQAREEAETDPLTGLRNRRACDSLMARLCREGAPFGLVHMDLDFFKAVNDTLGHAAGDHVLVHVAGVMKTASRSGDCLARMGGDEFMMLLPGLTDTCALKTLVERLISQLTMPIPWQEAMCRISASAGYATVTEGEMPDPVQVMARADAALYMAKNAGRGRAVLADDQPEAGLKLALMTGAAVSVQPSADPAAEKPSEK
ncbi:MAG: GGDEF domain-containing protein [Paracoccaceae bacterium]